MSEEPQKQRRAEYGMPADVFVAVWQASESVGEVVETLGKLLTEAGYDPMPRPIVIARASTYRREGVDLKKFKSGRLAVDKAYLNGIIEKIRGLQQVDIKPLVPRVPPPEEPTEPRPSIEDLLNSSPR